MVLTGFSQLHPRCSILTSTYDFEKRRSFLVDGSIQLEQAIVARPGRAEPAPASGGDGSVMPTPPGPATLHTIAVSLSGAIKGFLRNESSQPAARPLRLSRSQPGTGGAAGHGPVTVTVTGKLKPATKYGRGASWPPARPGTAIQASGRWTGRRPGRAWARPPGRRHLRGAPRLQTVTIRARQAFPRRQRRASLCAAAAASRLWRHAAWRRRGHRRRSRRRRRPEAAAAATHGHGDRDSEPQ